MNYPFNDTDMTYDVRTHRYTLTPDIVANELNLSLDELPNTGGVSDRGNIIANIIARASRQIYNYIYSTSIYNDIQCYMLAKVPSLRDVIKTAMLEQVDYLVQNGDISALSGVNARTSTIMSKADLRRAQICENARDVLDRQISEIGCPITYRGAFTMHGKVLPDYEGSGY